MPRDEKAAPVGRPRRPAGRPGETYGDRGVPRDNDHNLEPDGNRSSSRGGRSNNDDAG